MVISEEVVGTRTGEEVSEKMFDFMCSILIFKSGMCSYPLEEVLCLGPSQSLWSEMHGCSWIGSVATRPSASLLATDQVTRLRNIVEKTI